MITLIYPVMCECLDYRCGLVSKGKLHASKPAGCTLVTTNTRTVSKPARNTNEIMYVIYGGNQCQKFAQLGDPSGICVVLVWYNR